MEVQWWQPHAREVMGLIPSRPPHPGTFLGDNVMSLAHPAIED
jgi:hypothetical protein